MGLVVVIFGVVRSGWETLVAFAVGGYITAVYWVTTRTGLPRQVTRGLGVASPRLVA